MSRYANMLERIKANSKPGEKPTYADEPCWIWQGRVRFARDDSYPAMNVWRDKKIKTVSAHREAILASGRRLGPKQIARHMCHNTLCVNPAHLKVGTSSQNRKDQLKRSA